MQARVAIILKKYVLAAKSGGGAAVVIDPATGDLLSSVSYPSENLWKARSAVPDRIPENSELSDSLLDRARYGLYPPGSSFKIVTAIAALQSSPEAETMRFECKRLPDGRIGNRVRDWANRGDDVLDKEPHGSVDVVRGLIHSCNAYFAQRIWSEPTAASCRRPIRDTNRHTLPPPSYRMPPASYGRAVVASPLQMARVAGSVGNAGQVCSTDSSGRDVPAGKPCLTADQAARLSQYMRRVVTEGTGGSRPVGSAAVGKTGRGNLNKPACVVYWLRVWFPVKESHSRSVEKQALRRTQLALGEIADTAAEFGLIGRE
jgi:cell division protein FtsI/penicillin-binding protein 2